VYVYVYVYGPEFEDTPLVDVSTSEVDTRTMLWRSNEPGGSALPPARFQEAGFPWCPIRAIGVSCRP